MFFKIILLFVFISEINMESLSIKINKTWNSLEPKDKSEIEIKIQPNMLMPNQTNEKAVVVTIQAPFYDDPKLPNGTPKGSFSTLYNYEVVEVFFLGQENSYLEFELGPHGQYLVLAFKGARHLTKGPLKLNHFNAEIKDKKWTGKAYIPMEYFPNNTNKFNAYAIHGSNQNREYLSHFPTPFGKYKEPDFHRLEYFHHLNIKIN